MSLVGKRVRISYPVSNEKTEEVDGVILDKFNNCIPGEKGEVLNYDNYLIQKDNDEVMGVHPTLIKKVLPLKKV